MAKYGIGWYRMVLDGIGWYWLGHWGPSFLLMTIRRDLGRSMQTPEEQGPTFTPTHSTGPSRRIPKIHLITFWKSWIWDQSLPENMKWSFSNMGSISSNNMKSFLTLWNFSLWISMDGPSLSGELFLMGEMRDPPNLNNGVFSPIRMADSSRHDEND